MVTPIVNNFSNMFKNEDTVLFIIVYATTSHRAFLQDGSKFAI